jgi:hypothetical protein
MKRALVLLVTHSIALAAGFALGVYLLPILIAPAGPTAADVAAKAAAATYSAQFRRDLKDSDLLHWGEGRVTVGKDAVTLAGRLAPGPDYKLYLSPEFVETEADFNRLKSSMRRVGEVKTFENYRVQLPSGVDVSRFNTVIVWCDTCGQFISSAKYR